ncbi:MAG: VOC family protein [Nitrospirae bacterium]|nr:VOC family protein [Nitrospirota bacterium]
MFNKINYITLVVKDMQKSISFYKEVLGLTVKMNMPQWAEFEMEGTSLALTPETAETKIDPMNNDSGISLGFQVKDLDRTYSDLRKKGATFPMPPMDQGYGFSATFEDPNGYKITLTQSKW